MAQNAGHIAQPCRRGRSLRTVCGDSDPCAVFELNHLEPVFFPRPCAGTPTPAETPTRAETRILTVLPFRWEWRTAICTIQICLRQTLKKHSINHRHSRRKERQVSTIRNRKLGCSRVSREDRTLVSCFLLFLWVVYWCTYVPCVCCLRIVDSPFYISTQHQSVHPSSLFYILYTDRYTSRMNSTPAYSVAMLVLIFFHHMFLWRSTKEVKTWDDVGGGRKRIVCGRHCGWWG